MIFVTATDTGVGKTFFAAKLLKQALDQGLDAAYYKPVQCGKPTDYDAIREQFPGLEVYCSYDLKTAASPDYAASLEGVEIDLEKIRQDWQEIKTKHDFILVEGAGGLAVPLSDKLLISDIAQALALPVLLVIGPQLGTINHSLLSIEHARSKGLELHGLLVSDLGSDKSEREKASLETISRISGLKLIEDLVWMS